jgi:conjugal transfer mating pair stabilization protein TraN
VKVLALSLFCLGSLMAISLTAASPIDRNFQQGRDFAHSALGSIPALGADIDFNDLLPEEDKGRIFDAQEAKSKLLSGEAIVTDVSVFLEEVHRNEIENQCFDGNEQWIAHASDLTAEAAETGKVVIEEGVLERRRERCIVNDAPQGISVIRDLHVDVKITAEVWESVRICRGHYWKEKARRGKGEKRAGELRLKFAQDPSIQSYNVWSEHQGLGHRDDVHVSVTHSDNCSCCDSYVEKRVSSSPEKVEENDEWRFDQASLDRLFANPNASFIGRRPLDSGGERTIQGVDVYRPCWRDEMTFVVHSSDRQNCPFLRHHNCQIVRKTCLKEGISGCSVWEYLFDCWSPLKSSRRSEALLDNPALTSVVEEPNESFSDVAVTLSILSSAKKEIEESEASDTRFIQIFSGKSFTCGRSIVGEYGYDCCRSLSGLANELHLSQCSPEELHLAELRRDGRCHYVGRYSDTTIGVKTSDRHVYCCFGSKLARVVNEQGRDQLKILWGEPKHPDCRGLYQDEFSKLNFSKMDLSELYEELSDSSSGLASQIDSLKTRVKIRLEEMGDDR